MPVAELEQRMSMKEFGEWLEYLSYDPFGNERLDLASAMICSLLANINRDDKRHPKPFTILDFMPHFKGNEPKKQLQAEQIAIAKGVNEAMEGETIKGKPDAN